MVRELILRAICFIVLISGMSVSAGNHWTEPRLVTEISGDFNTISPFLSFDGKSLYFGADKYHRDTYLFYVATRPQSDGPFVSVVELSQLNDANAYSFIRPDGRVVYRGPSSPITNVWVSADNLRIYYTTSYDIRSTTVYCSERTDISQAWGRSNRAVYTDSNYYKFKRGRCGFSLTTDELSLVFTMLRDSRAPSSDAIFTVQRESIDENFGSPYLLDDVNSEFADLDPFIMPNGLTIYFVSAGNNGFKIFRADRPTKADPFANMEMISDIGVPGCDLRCPALSADGNTIYFEVQKNIDGRQVSSKIYYSRLIQDPAELAKHLIKHAVLEKENAANALSAAMEFERQAIQELQQIKYDHHRNVFQKRLLRAKVFLTTAMFKQWLAEEAIEKSLEDLDKAMAF